MAANNKKLKIDDALDAIEKHLMERREQVSLMAAFGNSFEAWLKFEIAALFSGQPWSRKPWVYKNGACTNYGWVGLEWRTKVAPAACDALEDRTKLIDFWVCETSGETPRTHYFELKLVFNNANANKMIFSWVEDLRLLHALDPEVAKPASYNALAVAVGFTLDDWTHRTDDHLTQLAAMSVQPTRRGPHKIADAPAGRAVLIDVITIRI